MNQSDISVYEVEGIGYDFIPTVLDHSVVDKWIKTNDSMSLPMARRLIREEGFLCGGSSGAAMSAAIEAARSLSEDQTCVVLCPDNIRNYMTKFVVDNWMEARDFQLPVNSNCHFWWGQEVSAVVLKTPFQEIPLNNTISCRAVIDKLKANNIDHIPVTDKNGKLTGVATTSHLMNKMLDSSLNLEGPISDALFKKFVKVNVKDTVGKLSRILEKEPFVVVVETKGKNLKNNQILLHFFFSDDNYEVGSVEFIVGVLTQKDLLRFI